MQQGVATEGSVIVHRFRTAWSQRFGTLSPFGWVLREKGGQPWLRLHALPGSQRYAIDNDERAEILRRAYILGAEVLGEGADCWLAEARWHWADEERRLEENAYKQTCDDDPAFIDTVWHIHVSLVRWTRGAFDPLIRMVADDEAGPVIWMACDSGAVFAPYDGGFDLFPSSWDNVVRLRADHAAWLPQNLAGL